MVQAGVGGLDTPRTNLGDATYLSTQQLDFDISQEQSFQSPSKDNNNLVQQLQNGRRGAINLKTPRSRAALGDRRNLPAGLGGGEFTPLLKSATRNSALRLGKENVPATPAFLKPGGLNNIPEDLSPLPHGSSVYGDSRNGSYMVGTPMPQIDSSSAASTPMALLPRRNEGPGVLQDGNQLSLREQENVIDKIEKENFGLKLKIHFLEEALRKAGPGFSEAALKENTELKVDKVTMQKELLRFRRTLATAEKDVDIYRQQFMEMQDKVKRKMMDQDQRQELDHLRETLEERDAELNRLKSQEIQFEDLQDKIDDLKADLREKDRLLDDRDDELENLKDDLEKRDNTISELQSSMKDAQRRAVELEEKAQVSEELEEAKETIEDLEQSLKRAKAEAQEAREELEQDLRRLEEAAEDAKEEREDAIKEKERAEADLQELQEEIANKSMTTKGRSRQIEEKANRLQDELEALREKYASLEEDHADKVRDIKKLVEKLEELNQDSEVREQKLKDKIDALQNESQASSKEKEALLKELEKMKSEKLSSDREHEALLKRLEATQSEHHSSTKERETFLKRVESIQNELNQKSDEKNLLQIRHDTLTAESASLQRDLARSEKTVEDLEDKLEHEKTLSLDSERAIRDQYKSEINRLNDRIDKLEAELEETKRDYNSQYELLTIERNNMWSQKEMDEEKAASLQRTIDRLQEAEGSLTTKEEKLKQALESEKERHATQESILQRQIKETKHELDAKHMALEDDKDTMFVLRDELRTSQREQKVLTEKVQELAEKVEGLEDEVEILQTSLDDESEQANNEIAAAKKESDNLRQQLRSLKDDLARAESTVASTRAELEAFQGNLQAGQGSNQQLSSRLRDVESQRAGVRQEKLGLQGQLASLQSELQSLSTSKADAEAERDEFQSQVRSLQRQEEDTFRLDQERMDLRTSKMKLDGEIRRLREENKAAVAQREAIEQELQQEIDRAGAEEARLSSEIGDLQRILRGSSEKKELAAARKTIQKLEARIQELEAQAASADGQTDVAHELSIIRHDLSSARQKETEFLQREAAQKDVVRNLKRQITDLERKAHEAEVSRFVSSSPHSSIQGSARKSEIIELRAQLATAHQTLKEVRSQLKDAEKEASKKMTALNIDIQAQQSAWESEKDELEHALDEAELAREELEAKNATSEATVTRLRSKIDRLEKALEHERKNTGEDRSIVAERRDLHEMLRETQLQAESLEIVVQERDRKIAAITSAEQELRAQMKRVRDERALHRAESVSLHEQLENLERKYKKAKDKWITEKKTWETQIKTWEEEMTHHDAEKAHWDAEKKHWDAEERHWSIERQTWLTEKKNLTRGVRFANMSLSVNDDSDQLAAMKQAMEEREKMHVKEMRGRAMQLEWLRAKCQREENFRDDAAYAKRYMGMQIELYKACNEADIRILESAGIQRPARREKKKPTLRLVAIAIRATVRMKIGAAKWAESRKISERIEAKIEQQKLQALQQQKEMQAAKKSGGRR